MQSVTEQQDTLNAIIAYNNGLKPARKKKDTLPEIVTNNITMRDRFVKEPKKGKVIQEFRYHKIGNLDEGVTSAFTDDKFSISAKQRAIQRTASLQRIDTIRTSYANLLGFTPKKPPTDVALLPPATEPVRTFVDGFTRKRDPELLDNPFSADKAKS